jgi:acyl transferase domain-containing protein
MALAGGASIVLPQETGYLFEEGGIQSPDGRTRAFDRNAQGTVFSSGAGLVVLKRLEDAFADRDRIHAVIRGAALNNDGAEKASFTAPSAKAHAEVIALAHGLAGVNARSISYVETHGTATPIGDPIEIAGLTEAFRHGTADTGFCAIGSVKTNVGHLDIAAGVAGLIKTTMALAARVLPPSRAGHVAGRLGPDARRARCHRQAAGRRARRGRARPARRGPHAAGRTPRLRASPRDRRA